MRKSNLITLTATLAVALAITVGAAHAHGRGGPGGGPCRQDLQTLCPNVTPGPGAFRGCLATLCPQVPPGPGAFGTCLQQHEDQLSADCKAHIDKMQAKIAAWHEACGNDVQTLCGDVSGRHGVFKCLHQHQDELSQTCQDLLAEHHGHHCHHGQNPTPTS